MHNSKNTYVGVAVELHAVLITAPNGDKWSSRGRVGVGGRLWLSEDQRQVKEQVAWLSDSTRTARVVAV